jgi:hypothetical protein
MTNSIKYAGDLMKEARSSYSCKDEGKERKLDEKVLA